MSIRHDTVQYADNGNILKKTDVGSYTYDPVRIYATTEITNPYGIIKDAQQYITYNSFLQPDTIREGAYTLIYTYGYDGNRIKSVLIYNNVVKETKYYLGDYEKVISEQGTAIVHYIAIDGQLKVIIDTQGSTHTPHYVYTDHLGSIIKVTNAAGTDEVVQTFDPWGRRRDYSTWTYIDENLPLGHPIWLYRGYTGHEHLPQFHLINMNGRMYDPELARMLSPDNLIPNLGHTQSYNKYSYGFNNPLKYIDPDGNEPITLTTIIFISTFVSVSANGISNHFHGKPFYDGAVKAAFWGAATGAVSFGIGGLANSIGNVYLRFGFQAAAHGLYNGISSELQGGRFVHGFVAGAIGSIGAGIGKDVLKLGTVGQIILGGVTGGLASAAAGGDFYRGFAQALIVSAFNHAVHAAADNAEGDLPKIGDKVYQKVGNNGAFIEYTYTANGWVAKFYPGSSAVQTTDSPLEWGLAAGLRALKFTATVVSKEGAQLLLNPGAAKLTQKGLEHIVARHWFTSGAKGAGKFAEGTTGAGLKSMINTTTTQGVFRANTMGRAGTIAEYNFGRIIGTSSSGAPASSLRVVIGNNGNVITAFPF